MSRKGKIKNPQLHGTIDLSLGRRGERERVARSEKSALSLLPFPSLPSPLLSPFSTLHWQPVGTHGLFHAGESAYFYVSLITSTSNAYYWLLIRINNHSRQFVARHNIPGAELSNLWSADHWLSFGNWFLSSVCCILQVSSRILFDLDPDHFRRVVSSKRELKCKGGRDDCIQESQYSFFFFLFSPSLKSASFFNYSFPDPTTACRKCRFQRFSEIYAKASESVEEIAIEKVSVFWCLPTRQSLKDRKVNEERKNTLLVTDKDSLESKFIDHDRYYKFLVFDE